MGHEQAFSLSKSFKQKNYLADYITDDVRNPKTQHRAYVLGLGDALGFTGSSLLATASVAGIHKWTREGGRALKGQNPRATIPPAPPKSQKITVTEDMRPGLRNRQLRGRYGTLKANQSTGQGLGLLQSGRTVTGG